MFKVQMKDRLNDWLCSRINNALPKKLTLAWIEFSRPNAEANYFGHLLVFN